MKDLALYDQQCRQAYDIITRNYAEHFTIEEISEAVALNTFLLKRCFKLKYGMTLYGCLERKRIEEAKKLLSVTDDEINVVANLVGYKNGPVFITAFKRITGTTPYEWRRTFLESAASNG